jgi:hypothetical protein
MKRLMFFCSVLMSFSIMVPKAWADDEHACSNADLRGLYSFVASGTVTGKNPDGLPLGAFAAAGKTMYDGSGNASGLIEVSLNGTIVSSAWQATYDVDPGTCTATKALTLAVNGATVNFFITFGDDFRELRFIATDAGTAISGTARKQ